LKGDEQQEMQDPQLNVFMAGGAAGAQAARDDDEAQRMAGSKPKVGSGSSC
jgi:hypothetical protein